MSMPEIRPGGPSFGLPEGVYLAPLGRRVAAFAIDAVVPYLLFVLAGVLLGVGAPVWLAVIIFLLPLAWAIVLWWSYATRAAGPGMRLMRLQVVGMRDGRPIGWSRALLRAVVLTVCSGLLVAGIALLVLMLQQIRRQGWHDLLVDSVVIEERQLAPKRVPAPPAASVGAPSPDPAPEPIGPDTAPADAPAAATSPEAGSPDLRLPRHAVIADPRAGDEADGVHGSEQPAPAGAGSAAEPDPGGTWYAALDDGRELPITGLLLLGRNPAPRPGEESAQLIKITDEARTVSKTHLSLDSDDSGVVVADRGSTNGSAITDPSGVYQLLTAGQPVRLTADGYQVSFGSHHLRLSRR